jgi:uncharacterized delta-60 repeat protein
MMLRAPCSWFNSFGLLFLIFVGIADAQDFHDGFGLQVSYNVVADVSSIQAIAVQPDGRIVLAGIFTDVYDAHAQLDIGRNNIARARPDGSIDTSFVDPQVDGRVDAVAIQSDGKILIGGDFTSVGGHARNHLARLNANGTLDTAFTTGFPDSVLCLTLQHDGRILVGGTFSDASRQHLARLLPDGSLDASFTTGTDGAVLSIAVASDDKLLIGGAFLNVGGIAHARIARLMPNGTLDGSFVATADDVVYAIALQADGRVLIGGAFGQVRGVTRHYFARLISNGVPDTFAPAIDGTVASVLVQPDGRILIGGGFSHVNGFAKTAIARLDSHGANDAFAASANAPVFSLALQQDGKIVFGGSFDIANGLSELRIARVYPDGTNDVSLLGGIDNTAVSVVQQNDGKLLLAGYFQHAVGQARTGLVRLWPNGQTDAAFDAQLNDSAFIVAQQDDNWLVIGGPFTQVGGLARHHIARVAISSGAPDTSFADPNADGAVTHCVLQADGKIIVAGEFKHIGGQARYKMARLLPNGALDTAYMPEPGGGIQSMALQADGKLFVAGLFPYIDGQAAQFLARLDAAGHLDTSFVPPSGLSLTDAVVIQPDGKILLANEDEVVRLNANGSLDSTFHRATISNGAALAIVLRSDGRIVVTGTFDHVNGSAHKNLVRLNPDGTVDNTFIDPTMDGAGYGLAIQDDGKLIVVGDIANIGGTPRIGIIRLSTPEAALQSLNVNGSAVVWKRSGSGPEVAWPPTLNATINGADAGHATMLRVAGGWRSAGFDQPLDMQFDIRATGDTEAGHSWGQTRLQRHLVGNDGIFADSFDG